jgi:hypothetical protein
MKPNPAVEELLNNHPLAQFSVYTDGQSRVVRELGQEILRDLVSGIHPDDGSGKGMVCETEVVARGYSQFWLWVLGAYEVVRTMCQAERCFSSRLGTELKVLKQRLTVIRIPFAKQELPGRRIPVRAEPSIYRIVDSPPDLRFEVDDRVISAAELICEFARVFAGITRADVLNDHRTHYSAGGRK